MGGVRPKMFRRPTNPVPSIVTSRSLGLGFDPRVGEDP